MPAPSEHKTACLCVSARRRVQARILKYAEEIGWAYLPRDEAERRRGFDPDGATPEEWARKASLFFGDLIDQPMAAQLRVHDLDLPELTSFTAKGAR
jgi:type I restriction enzyme R subunit